MRKLILVAALTALAACGKSPDKEAIANNAAMLQDALEAEADNMEALADNTADPVAEQTYQNVADHLKDARAAVRREAKQAKREVP